MECLLKEEHMHNNVLKKTLILSTIATLLLLAGCGMHASSKAQKAGDSFLTAMIDGDFDAMEKYADPALFEGDGEIYAISEIQTFVRQISQTLIEKNGSVSDSAKQELQTFVDRLMEDLVMSYELLGDKMTDDQKYRMKTTITYGFDPDTIPDLDAAKKLKKADGEEDLADILGSCEEKILATDEVTKSVILTVEKKDGDWLVTSMEIVS